MTSQASHKWTGHKWVPKNYPKLSVNSPVFTESFELDSLSPDKQICTDLFLEFVNDDDAREMVIDGRPGTGKSYLIRALLHAYRANMAFKRAMGLSVNHEIKDIAITATTNKAAAVLADDLKVHTQTIHQLLHLYVFEDHVMEESHLRKKKNWRPLDNLFVFVDEYSYVDRILRGHIDNTLRHNCKIVYLGDKDQILPRGETSAIIYQQTPEERIGHLVQQFRQDHQEDAPSNITLLSEAYQESIYTKRFPNIANYLGNGVEYQSVEVVKQTMQDSFVRAVNTHDANYARVLAWRNEDVIVYNQFIRGFFTEEPLFEPNEKVLTNKPIACDKLSAHHSALLGQTKDAFINAESVLTIKKALRGMGPFKIPDCPLLDGVFYLTDQNLLLFVPDLTADNKNRIRHIRELLRENQQFSVLEAFNCSLQDLRSAYSVTSHKSQGSTYNHVFIDLSSIGRCTNADTFSRMMNVSVSRAKEKVVFFGKLPPRYL